MTREKKFYYVGSNGDAPDQRYFTLTLTSAQHDEHLYIDIFNFEDIKISAFKRKDDSSYTEDF